MLLNHRSGLRNHHRAIQRSSPTYYEDRTRIFTPDEILAWVEDAVDRRPDQQLRVLEHQLHLVGGKLIERVNRHGSDTALQLAVSEPLGLDATRFATVESGQPRRTCRPMVRQLSFHGAPRRRLRLARLQRMGSWGRSPRQPANSPPSSTGLFAGKLISRAPLDEIDRSTRSAGYGLGLELYPVPVRRTLPRSHR